MELIELPQQNLLAERPVDDYHVVRLDTGVILKPDDKKNEALRRKLEKEQFATKNADRVAKVSCTDSVEEAVNLISNSVKVVLITSSELGQNIMPIVERMKNLEKVIVFDANAEWAKHYSKVQLVTDNYE